MKNSDHFEAFFACGMLLFCMAIITWIPLKGSLDARLTETTLSLETSQGRERKQEYEYSQVSEELPATRAELAATQPLADAASKEVTDLKARRKELRAEKKRLESRLDALQTGSSVPSAENGGSDSAETPVPSEAADTVQTEGGNSP